MAKGNLELVKLLLANDAKLTPRGIDYYNKAGESYSKVLAHVATSSCMKDRHSKDKRQILRELVRAGLDLNVENNKGRNPLHFSVNDTTDEADQSLDLELVLLKGGCDTTALDDRGRLPLHYAFVKAGRHREAARSDPIEVVSLIVEAMEDKGVAEGHVDKADSFGATPLHYAAYRGATVSCLLLLQKGADINAVDKKGNSPLAYAVMGKHEGCALVLLQQGASVNVSVYPVDMVDNRKKPVKFRYLKEHFQQKDETEEYTLFQVGC